MYLPFRKSEPKHAPTSTLGQSYSKSGLQSESECKLFVTGPQDRFRNWEWTFRNSEGNLTEQFYIWWMFYRNIFEIWFRIYIILFSWPFMFSVFYKCISQKQTGKKWSITTIWGKLHYSTRFSTPSPTVETFVLFSSFWLLR